MLVSRPVSRSSSWASDLVHPLPLAAVALLALNDHVLKGSGLLPGAVTGKLSDLAGLFFFPLLLAAALRGLSRAARGRDIVDRRSLAAAVSIATALGFAAVKLVPAFNAIIERTWGRMVMDPSDLWALPMTGLAAAWMLRATSGDRSRATSGDPSGAASITRARSPRLAAPTDQRRALDLTAVLLAGLASAATSKQPDPPPPPPPQPGPVAVAEDPSCVSLTIDTCERTATQTLVVVRAQSRTGEQCTVDVLRAEEASYSGHTAADVLPKNIVLRGSESRTFALTFLRGVHPDERNGELRARAQLSATTPGGGRSVDEIELVGGCVGR